MINSTQSNASPIYTIENLDDLFDAYYSGKIDYSTFSILYEAYDLGGLTESDLKSLNISDRTELNFLFEQKDTTGFWQKMLAVDRGKLGARRYSSDKDYVYSNYFANIYSRGFAVEFDVRNYNKRYEFRRRAVSWNGGLFDITAGNYLIREACGLTLGCYDYQPSAGFDKGDDLYLLSPVNSYYNGVNFSVNTRAFSSAVYYSYKEYNDYQKTMLGAVVGLKYDLFQTKLLAGYNHLTYGNLDDNRPAMGVNVTYEGSDYSLSSEYTVVNKSGGLYIQAQKQLSSLMIESEFWHYGNDFNNYNCSGPAASDYNSFYPVDDELGFRSSQAGETGASFNYHIKDFDTGLQMWDHAESDCLNSSLYLRSLHSIYDDFSLGYQIAYRNKQSGGYFWTKVHSDLDLWYVDRVGIKVYYKESSYEKGNSYAYSNFHYKINKQLALLLKLRLYMNNQLYWYISESFTTAIGLRLKGEVSYKSYARINLKVEKIL